MAIVRTVNAVQWALVVTFLLTGDSADATEPGDSCVNPAGEPGVCILLRGCQPLVDLYHKPHPTADDTAFLTSSRCGTYQRKALVCCAVQKDLPPADIDDNQLPELPHCGIYLSDRVIGGTETKVDEFPWMALIEYRKMDNTFGFHCGGTLINQRYVLTAAHCVTSLPRGWKVYRVRLGEWDLTTIEDCQADCDINEQCPNLCIEPAVDVDFEKITVHSRYDSRDASKANDIALIRLSSRVKFSVSILPICLPVSEVIRKVNHEGMLAYAAGWGKTENTTFSERKLKVDMKIKPLDGCKPFYRRSGILLKPTHLCAGGERGKDTCTGDSGGPLMRMVSGAWHLLGLVSFGPHKCGTAGAPGIYVKVAEYMDWIKENLKTQTKYAAAGEFV